MAKIPFSKLGVKVDSEVVLLPWGEYNIEVRKYLPMNEKIEIVNSVINQSADDNGYYNPLRIKVYLTLEAIYAYSNISFTDKQKENVLKLYDMVISSGLFYNIIKLIPEEEWKDLQKTVWDTIANIYEYKNSVMGILDTVLNDYNTLDLDASTIQEKLADPKNLELLKGIMERLG